MLLLSLLFPLVSLGASLFDKNSAVVTLTSTNFQEKTNKSVYVVGFFATWCGHCQKFKSDFEKAANALSGVVGVGAVFEDEQQLMSSHSVKGFPTIKLFIPGKGSVDYSGERTAKALVDFALGKVAETVRGKLNGVKSDKSSKSEKKEQSVVVLTDKNFKSLVSEDIESVWLVEFYAPWCGHCKQLAPAWEAAAKKLKGKVKVAKVDATVETGLAQRFGIKGYPTIKLFPSGKKSDSAVVDYNQDRSESSIVAFAQKYISQTVSVEQLLSEEQFRTECEKGICGFAILPHIADSGASKRNEYLKHLGNAAKSSGAPVKFFWMQAGDQFDLEEKLNLNFGYPALLVTHIDKKVYGVHRGNFEPDSLLQFVVSLGTGGLTLSSLPKELPKLKNAKKWDGKDYQPKQEL